MVDPATQRNTHTLHAEGLFGEFHLELSGLPLAAILKHRPWRH
jgi:aspartate dehydrogenase